MSCSTNEKPYPKAMIQAEECITAHPDSALAYLATLKEEIKNEPKETQMYYNLLTIKAQDKAYMPHTSDSLIKITTDFYENYGDSDKLMEAYYYLGSVYRDMKDAPRALKAFQDAIDVGKTGKRYDILAQTYGQMGSLFAWQEIYDESLKSCKLALKYHLLMKNQFKVSIATRDLARMYHSQKKIDSARIYYDKAYKYISSLNNKEAINSFLSELGCFYYDIGKTELAKKMLLTAVKGKYDIKNAILNLGMIYQDAQQLDSAQYYFNQTLNTNDILKQQYALIHLSQIESERKNYQKALDYAYEYNKFRDSIEILTQTETIGKIQALYNYQHTEKDNAQLRLANENKRTQVYQLMSAIMIIIATGLSIFLHLRKKKQKAIEQERKLRLINEEKYAQSLEHIKENEKKIWELEQRLNEAKENDIVNRRIIQSHKEQLEHINCQVIAARNEQNLLEKTFEQSQIYLLFHKVSNDNTIKITEKEWTLLQIEIDKTYHNFTDHLYTLYPQLSLLELRICYLIKISMQVKDIANLLNRSKSAISIARTRLYKKIHRTEGTVEMLDQFIINL